MVGSPIWHLALLLLVGALSAALLYAGQLRAISRFRKGDLTPLNGLIIRYVAFFEDRLRPEVIEARSKALGNTLRIVYPWAARLAKLDGHARARFDLRDDGVPRNIEIVEASHPLFAKSLRRALMRARGRRDDSTANEPRQIKIVFEIASSDRPS